MMLFPGAGIEVVPTYTDMQTSWLDNRYHDESHPLYPRWRSYCSLPVNTVEKIRRSRLWERDFVIDKDEQQLINDSFDAIFINCSPGTLANILSWYRGKVLFRCNGGPNRTELYKDAVAWTETAKQAGRVKDFIYLPGHLNLVVPEMLESGVPIIHFPVFVDEDRVPGTWARASSSTVATAISYLDFHVHFQSQLRDVVRAYGGSPLRVRVFGKNKVSRTAADNVEIVGGLPSDQQFWSSVFECAAFVDAGADPTHTVFPPLEAAMKGMPTFFQFENGHAHAIRDCQPNIALNEKIGFLPTHDDIRQYLVKNHHDLNLLADINKAQVAVFRTIFSRTNALNACVRIGEVIADDDARLFVFGRRAVPSLVPFEPTPLKALLTDVSGSSADISRLNIRHGRRKGGAVVCPAGWWRTKAHQVVSEYLPEFAPGEYEISVQYQATPGWRTRPVAGFLELGKWAHGTDYQQELANLPIDESSASIRLTVDETSKHWVHEVRVAVFDSATVTLRTIGVRQVSDPGASANPAPAETGDQAHALTG